MKIRDWKYSGSTDSKQSKREIAHGEIARRAATEGIVLLKNDGMLPLDLKTSVALLGCGASKTMKGGIGSGDVNNRANVSIYQGFMKANIKITTQDYLTDYEARYEIARKQWKEKVLADAAQVANPFDAYVANPFVLPKARPVAEKDIKGATIAVYVISRICGEGRDRRQIKGDYYLSEQEERDLIFLASKKMPVVLILNAGGPIELTDILDRTTNIKSILNISQLGQEGGCGVTDILFGLETPSGRLTTTWAKRYEDYPSALTFGCVSGNLEYDHYKEGIFVGYRYFHHTDEKPLFPFGHGLSYTSFQTTLLSVKKRENNIEIQVQVKNIRAVYAGKEVVQIYLSMPVTQLEKENKRLVGFAKTKRLKPGEKQSLKITIEQKQLASFLESKHAWIIEAGKYKLCIGENAEKTRCVAEFKIENEIIVERTESIGVEEDDSDEIDVDETITDFHSVEELLPLLYGNITQQTSNLGAAGIHVPGSAGETTECLCDKWGIKPLVMADGPAGLRLRQSYQVDQKDDQIYKIGVLACLENGYLEPEKEHEDAVTYYQYCTAFPVGTALAQTWNTKLLEEIGDAVAEEMEEYHVNLWLAPGMNIHRNPLCGRNFEYFSEDPYLTGMLAAAVTFGVQSKHPCGVTIKHFACNNQEDNRTGVDVRITERALREIYLRGFEIAIKKSAPIAMMSSYNLINGVHAANNRDLCTTIARKEWKYEGVIMTDWDTTADGCGSESWKCIDAGNDLIMPGNSKDAKNIKKAFEEGRLKEKAIRCSAARIIKMINRF